MGYYGKSFVKQYGARTLHAGYVGLQTHTQNFFNINFFPLQHLLHKRATVLLYTSISISFLFIYKERHPYDDFYICDCELCFPNKLCVYQSLDFNWICHNCYTT